MLCIAENLVHNTNERLKFKFIEGNYQFSVSGTNFSWYYDKLLIDFENPRRKSFKANELKNFAVKDQKQ